MLDSSGGTSVDGEACGGAASPLGGNDLMNETTAVNRRLRAYAAQRAKLDAAEAFDLVRARELKIHALHGYATFFEYLERALGYAPHTARERYRVAKALLALPLTMSSLSKGVLAYSHVRELTRVVTPETEAAWLEATVDRNTTQVQELVATHEYGDLPDDPAIPDLRPRKMSLELLPEVVALWREASVALQEERGIGEVSDGDLMETLCRRFLNPGTGEAGPAQSIGYEQCPDCKRTRVSGAGRMLDVRREVAERLLCDARILGDLTAPHPERITQSVTPRMREQVFARDKCRCQVPGCRATRFLEVHHIIPQAQGGPHVLWNLILLCDGHHRALHDGLLFMSGRAPLEVVFKWKFAPIDIIETPADPARPLAVPGWVLDDGQTFAEVDRVIARVRRDERERLARDVETDMPGAMARWVRANELRASAHGTKLADTHPKPIDVPAGTRNKR
jgi:hypothetical protein